MGTLKDSLEQEAFKLGLADYVEFGYVEIRETYQAEEIMLAKSHGWKDVK